MSTYLQVFEKLLKQKEELESLSVIAIVEVEPADYKQSGYPNHDFFIVKGGHPKQYFMMQDNEDFGHEMVWQKNYAEDCYHGYLLYPIEDGKYIKCEYSC